MANGSTAIKTALGVFLVFGFASWILSLIGLAGLQRYCWQMPTVRAAFGANAQASGVFDGLLLTGIRGFSRTLDCNGVYRYYWFMFAFEFIALAGLAIMALVGLLAASALCWMAWLTVLSLLFIQGSDSFLAIADLTEQGLGSQTHNYARLTAVGWILTAVANLGLIFLLGWRPRRVGDRGGSIKY
eukprot:GHRR01000508.1.p1 GENE.GHRR01000508.1~~GHRR01000508.1.p1  ORF type:complete len:186 (+),score=31.43 GHRR01000508.1:387-944(+)